MKEYVVDISSATSWEDFIAAFNKGFIQQIGGDWHGNLNAFNDYLYWPDEHPYRLIIRGWQKFSTTTNDRRILDMRRVLDDILEIFGDNPQAMVTLE